MAMDSHFKAILALAIAASVGVMLVFLACALPAFGNWSPLAVTFFYFLSPIPLAISSRVGDSYGDSQRPLEVGVFLSTTFVLAGFGMPMVLAHAEVITVGAMLLTLMGNLLVYGSMIAYAIVFKEEGDW